MGYKEPTSHRRPEPQEEQPQDHVMEEVVETFKGSGVRLDGKKKKDSQLDMPVIKKVIWQEFCSKWSQINWKLIFEHVAIVVADFVIIFFDFSLLRFNVTLKFQLLLIWTASY